MVLASSTGETVAEFAEEGDDMERSLVVAILLVCISVHRRPSGGWVGGRGRAFLVCIMFHRPKGWAFVGEEGLLLCVN